MNAVLKEQVGARASEVVPADRGETCAIERRLEEPVDGFLRLDGAAVLRGEPPCAPANRWTGRMHRYITCYITAGDARVNASKRR
jgi:hypothetical protein